MSYNNGSNGSAARLKAAALIIFLCIAVVVGAPGPARPARPARHARPLIVAAAASMSFALEEIASSFEEETGINITLSIGSTGTLAAQITHGAPFDLFFSAGTRDLERLREGGFLKGDTMEVYARGRIVLVVNKSSGIEAAHLKDLLAPQVKRVAIANPGHAPYGAAAMQALKSVGLWGALKGKLVYAENIRQALRFVQTGDAQAGIVALSVMRGGGELAYTGIPETLHEPVNQAVAVVKHSDNPEGAMRFIRYVKGTQGRAVMKRYGFTLPPEGL